ncbi:protein-disulfide reductase DsbD [Motiliproteus sp.]|uniref:protein-disulfide reductase DsbD n=1 Tax=Motiliproteus sp. TaxID=1898955 RepID=UPI003BABDB36
MNPVSFVPQWRLVALPTFALLMLGLLLSLIAPANAQASVFDKLIGNNDGPLDVEEAYRFSSQSDANGVQRLFWQIEDDYYLYRDKIRVKPIEGIEVVEIRYPASKTKQDPLFGEVQVYYQGAEVSLQLRSTLDAPFSGPVEIEYQGCWEGGICYPPVTKTLNLSDVPTQVTPLAAGLVGSSVKQSATADTPSSANRSAFATTDEGLSLTDPRQYVERLSGGNLWLTLALFFGAGLALSLTPCVFPMIPILAGIIAGHGNAITSGKALRLSLVYVLSMSLTYTLVGVLAGLFGANLQASFQNPWIIGLFSGLFVVLSLAMFGFYELQLPQSLQSRLDNISRSQQGGQMAGVAVMGLLSALIVGPCVAAPLAGALVYIGQTGDPTLGGLALFSMSIGMGTPLILLGCSAGKLMPRAGSWMESVKRFFGVGLLLMAIWMLDRIVAPQVTMGLLAVVLIGSAVFLRTLDRLEQDAGAVMRLGKSLGVILLIYGAMLMVAIGTGQGTLLRPLQGIAGGGAAAIPEVRFTEITTREQLQPLLAEARRQQVPVMLDFYADWCVSCKELEVVTFADTAVVDQLDRFVTIKIDLTAHDDAAKALYQEYQIVGPPALVFYTKSGQRLDEAMLVGVPDPEDFLRHLQLVAES